MSLFLNSKKKTFQSNLINKLIKKGFKLKAFKLLIGVLTIIKKELKQPPLFEIYKILYNFSPIAYLKDLKLGSTKYLIPTPLTLVKQFNIFFI